MKKDDGGASGAPHDATSCARPAPGLPEDTMRTSLHWPLKLQLAPVDDGILFGTHLLICGDCTAFASRGFHDRAGKGKTMLVGCPKFEDSRLLKAKMLELFRTARPKSCFVARMEKPCCKGLVTVCAEAAKECDVPFRVEEVIVYCDGEMEHTGPCAPPRG